jgi:hypothetical protein
MPTTTLRDPLELASAGHAKAKPPERFELSTPALRKPDFSEPDGAEQGAEHRSTRAMLSASAHSEKRWVHNQEDGEPSRTKTAPADMAGQLDVEDDVESQLSEFETLVLATIRRLHAEGQRVNVALVSRELPVRYEHTRRTMVLLRRAGLWDPWTQTAGIPRDTDWVPSSDEIRLGCEQIRSERSDHQLQRHGVLRTYYEKPPARAWTVDDIRRDWKRREARRRRAGAAAAGASGQEGAACRAEETPRDGEQRPPDPSPPKPLERFLEAAKGLAAAGQPVTAQGVCRAAGLSLGSAWSFRAILEKRGQWRWKSNGRPLEACVSKATAASDLAEVGHMTVDTDVEQVLAGQPPSLLRVYQAACDLEADGQPVSSYAATKVAGLATGNATRYREKLAALNLWRWEEQPGRRGRPKRSPAVQLDAVLSRTPAPVLDLPAAVAQPDPTPSSNGSNHVPERVADDGEVVASVLEIQRMTKRLSRPARAALLRHLNTDEPK